jgi:hypothetical protein
MSSFEIRNLLGLRDGKRIYVIDSNHVSQEEYDYCLVLNNVLWGEKGYTETLGPTWSMVQDPRFEQIEAQFVVERAAVFGGDARLGKQYVDGNSLMSHSMAELETYAEILGEGRHFASVIRAEALAKRPDSPELAEMEVKNFYKATPEVMWRLIRQECPNYFDNVKGEPNARAQRLLQLFRSDLVGLVSDYAEVALVQEWVKVDTGETATDFSQAYEDPVVYAEIDILERALTLRASLRVTAVKILDKSGMLSMMEKRDIKLTETEVDQLLKIVYSMPYEKLYEAPMRVMEFINKTISVPYEMRIANQTNRLKRASAEIVNALKDGSLQPLSMNGQEEVNRELTFEEKQIVSLRENPYRLELFLMFTDAEAAHDKLTMDAILPILEDLSIVVDEDTVLTIKNKTRLDRTSSAARNVLGMS